MLICSLVGRYCFRPVESSGGRNLAGVATRRAFDFQISFKSLLLIQIGDLLLAEGRSRRAGDNGCGKSSGFAGGGCDHLALLSESCVAINVTGIKSCKRVTHKKL